MFFLTSVGGVSTPVAAFEFHSSELIAPITWGYEVWDRLLQGSRDRMQRGLELVFPNVGRRRVRRHFTYRPSVTDDWNSTGDFIFGAEVVQSRLFAHQNPLSCAGKNFIVMGQLGATHGLGSELHYYATNMIHAVEMSRLLIWDPNVTRVWSDGSVCGRVKSYDCFFLPLTNCSLRRASNTVLPGGILELTKRIPHWLEDLLRDSVVAPEAFTWYWHAHVISYFWRLNARMESLIVSRKRSHGIPGRSLADVHFDVTVHIRHGDKAAEMRLVPAARYIEVCRGIRRFLGRNISVFLLTDDPDALSEFQTRSDFDLFWLHYDFRGDNVHAKWVEHGDQAGLIGVEGVVLGARSDFYVGTFASNYDRIILHTKAVRYGGSSGWYFEVGERKCVTVAHCALLREEFDWQEVWLR